MTTKTRALTSVSSPGRHTVNDPVVRFCRRISFVSTCPACGRKRLQHAYTRRSLFSLLNTRRTIDAYCIVCNVCWPISKSERHAIAPQ
jgi:hypothetical protein